LVVNPGVKAGVSVGVGDRFVEAGIDDVSRFGVTNAMAGLAEPLEISNYRSPFPVEVSLGHPACFLRSMVEVPTLNNCL
jgi:hypothetical protein